MSSSGKLILNADVAAAAAIAYAKLALTNSLVNADVAAAAAIAYSKLALGNSIVNADIAAAAAIAKSKLNLANSIGPADLSITGIGQMRHSFPTGTIADSGAVYVTLTNGSVSMDLTAGSTLLFGYSGAPNMSAGSANMQFLVTGLIASNSIMMPVVATQTQRAAVWSTNIGTSNTYTIAIQAAPNGGTFNTNAGVVINSFVVVEIKRSYV